MFEGEAFYVLGMIDPRRKAAVMVVPYDHVETPFDIAPEAWGHLKEALDFAKEYLQRFEPAGFTMGWNVGEVAGQTVPHVHLHVVCRFEGEKASGYGLNAMLKNLNGEPYGR